MGCDVGEVLPCPEGWQESKDGLYCDPGYGECAAGERGIAGGDCQRVLPLLDECPDGPFPEVPPGASDVLYVDTGSACLVDCGSEASPYPKLQAAIDAATPGTVLLVAEGTYEEVLTIEQAISIIGLCAAKTVVHASAFAQTENEKPMAALTVAGADGVKLSGLGVLSVGPAMDIGGASVVQIQDVEVVGSAGYGVRSVGSHAELTRVWIHDTKTSPAGVVGNGVLATGGATVAVAESLLEFAQEGAIEASGQGTSVNLQTVTIRDTQLMAQGARGNGLRVLQAATLIAHECLLERNHSAAILVKNGGNMNMTNSVVRTTETNADNYYGSALDVQYASTARLTRCILTENRASAIAAFDDGSLISLEASALLDTQPLPSKQYGRGIQASNGCEVDLKGVLVQNCRDIGLGFYHEGTKGTGIGVIVSGTAPPSESAAAYAIKVESRASVNLQYSLIEDNEVLGVVVQGKASRFTLKNGSIRQSVPTLSFPRAAGLEVTTGGTANFFRSTLEGVLGQGIATVDEGSKVTVQESIVRDIRVNEGEGGNGIIIGFEAHASIEETLLSDCQMRAIAVVEEGSRGDVHRCFVEANGVGTADRTGGAVMALLGAELNLVATALVANSSAGIVAFDPGTRLTLNSVLVRDTLPNDSGDWGSGLEVQKGANADIIYSLLQGNRNQATAAYHPGSTLRLQNSVIADTESNDEGVYGYGVVAAAGTNVEVLGTLVEAATNGGIAASGIGTTVKLEGAIVRDTQVSPSGEMGNGLGITIKAAAEANFSLLSRNSTASVLVYDPGSSVTMTGSAVTGTKAGGAFLPRTGDFQGFGDGIFAAQGTEVNIVDSVFAHNERCGIYFQEAEGRVAGSLTTDNAWYGMLLAAGSSQVDYADLDNHSFGNKMGDMPGEVKDIEPVPPPKEVKTMPARSPDD